MNFIRVMNYFSLGKIPAICFFLITFCMYAVPVQAGGSMSFRQEFKFSAYPTTREAIVNHFLLKIAEGNGKLRAYTSYTVGATLRYTVGQDEEGRCVLGMQAEDLDFSGDITYRAFGLEKLLMPDMISFHLTVKAPDGRVIFDRSYDDIRMSAPDLSVDVSLNSDICVKLPYSLEISNLRMYYSEQLFQDFDAWLDALKTYYSAGDALSAIDSMLREIGLDDPERLIMDEFILCEAEQRLAEVRYASFHRWLDLSNGDPERLLVDYDRLSWLADSLRRGFNQAIAHIDTLLYEKALVLQHEGDNAHAQRLYHQALVYNPFHVPSKLSIAHYELATGNKVMALQRMERVLSDIYPAGLWREKSVALTDSVLHDYFMDVAEFNIDGRYLDALALLTDVERFCDRTIGWYECPELLVYHKTLAHRGMFRSFMVVSERAYRNGSLSFCAEYLQSALAYQDENADYVPEPVQAVALMKQVVAQYIQMGEASYANRNLYEAFGFFRKARELCDLYSFLGCGE